MHIKVFFFFLMLLHIANYIRQESHMPACDHDEGHMQACDHDEGHMQGV